MAHLDSSFVKSLAAQGLFVSKFCSFIQLCVVFLYWKNLHQIWWAIILESTLMSWMHFSSSFCGNCFQSDDITRVARAAKIVERMVNQNTYEEVALGKSPFSNAFRIIFQTVKSLSSWPCCFLLKISSIMKIPLMSTETKRELCFHCGNSLMRNPRNLLSHRYVGVQNLWTFLWLDTDHVSCSFIFNKGRFSGGMHVCEASCLSQMVHYWSAL